MAKYLVASPEGAEHFKAELGDLLDLELSAEEELPLVCAGWLEPAPAKKD